MPTIEGDAPKDVGGKSVVRQALDRMFKAKADRSAYEGELRTMHTTLERILNEEPKNSLFELEGQRSTMYNAKQMYVRAKELLTKGGVPASSPPLVYLNSLFGKSGEPRGRLKQAIERVEKKIRAIKTQENQKSSTKA